MRSISIEYHRIHKKKYTIITGIYFCIVLRRFTQKTLLQRVVSRWNVCRQRGRVARRVGFTTVMFAGLTVRLPPKPRCCVLGEDASQQLLYLCLVESNKQQIEEVRSKIQAENSETQATPKRVRDRPTHSASVAFS